MTFDVGINAKIPNRSWHSVAHDATRYSMKTYQLLISTTLLTTLLGCAATATEEEDQGSSVESLTETAAGCAQLTDCIYRKADEDRGGRNPYEHVSACFFEDVPPPRGIPLPMKQCIYFRGGMACWSNKWPSCAKPVAQNPRQEACLYNGGGLSCFDRR